MAKTIYSVAIYLESLAYGGPEEGGWWFDAGEIEANRRIRQFTSEDDAYTCARRLNALLSAPFGPNAGRRDKSSVLSEGVFTACVFEGVPPVAYPESRPFYE